MADLLEVVHAQRACRSFDPAAELSDSDIEVMLDAAVHAPSAENSQPWVFVVIRDDATRAALSQIWSGAWAIGAAQVRESVDPTLFQDLERGMGQGGFGTAPVVVVVSADLERVSEMYAECSVFPATQNLLLAASALGHASCLTTGLTTFFADQVRDLLALPETIKPLATVYLGSPATPLRRPRRRPALDTTHRERYGEHW